MQNLKSTTSLEKKFQSATADCSADDFSDELPPPIPPSIISSPKASSRSMAQDLSAGWMRVKGLMATLRKKQSIKAYDYLKMTMASVDEKVLSKNEKIKADYTHTLKSAVGRVNSSCILDYSDEFSEQLLHSVDYNARILNFIAQKMQEARLSVSVSAVNIVFIHNFQLNTVETTLVYELSDNGYIWSNIFSAFISKKLALYLGPSNGSINAVHHHNSTSKVETFTLAITHDVIQKKTAFLNGETKSKPSHRAETLNM